MTQAQGHAVSPTIYDPIASPRTMAGTVPKWTVSGTTRFRRAQRIPKPVPKPRGPRGIVDRGFWNDRGCGVFLALDGWSAVDRPGMYEGTWEAIVEVIFRYPSPRRTSFPWFRTVACQHALVRLQRSGLEDDQAPTIRHRAGRSKWRRSFDLRTVYKTVQAFYRATAGLLADDAAVPVIPRSGCGQAPC